MNRLQWDLKFGRYRNTKIINILLAVLTLLHLVLALYLFIPIVQPEKAKVSATYNSWSESREYVVTVELKPTTKYSLYTAEVQLEFWGGTGTETHEVTMYSKYDRFTFSYEEVDVSVSGVKASVISVKTESMAGDIFMLLLSIAGVVIGSVFLIGRLRMERKMPPA